MKNLLEMEGKYLIFLKKKFWTINELKLLIIVVIHRIKKIFTMLFFSIASKITH